MKSKKKAEKLKKQGIYGFVDILTREEADEMRKVIEDTCGWVSVEQYNKEIGEAMEEVKRGGTYSHGEVVKMAKDW